MTTNIDKKNILKNLSPEIHTIFDIFGDDIRLVGGCVRDMILNKKIHDYDFACKHNPDIVQQKLRQRGVKSIPTGIKYGTITAIINNQHFQITTLRRDLMHVGRDCEVNFTDDFVEDAKRRDFTINALYLDAKGTIYDYFDGIDDLKNKKVRFIGDSTQRISEDFLRILRFFRFSCDYASELDKSGLEASINFKNSLKIISKERIREEFYKILNSTNYSQVIKILKIFREHNFDKILWDCDLDTASFERVIDYLKFVAKKDHLLIKMLTLFLNDELDKNIFFDSFKCTNNEKKFIEQYRKIVANHDSNHDSNHYSEGDLNHFNSSKINILLVSNSKDFLINFYAIYGAKNYRDLRQNDLENIISYIKNKSIPLFPLEFSDLETLGLPKNKLGTTYKKLKFFWAENNFKNSKEILLKQAQNFLKK